MQRKKAPFRADHVGSLLRSETLKQARADRSAGKMDQGALAQIEDQEIKALVAKQESIGLQSITDGEFRRAFWHFDFLGGLGGVELFESDSGIQFKGVQTKATGVRVIDKLHYKPFPLFKKHHPSNTQNDHSLPVHAALPRRPENDQYGRLSRYGRFLPGSG